MTRMVQCAKLGKEAEGLDFPPLPGELGKRIYESISEGGVASLVEAANHADQRKSSEYGRSARAPVSDEADRKVLLRRRRGYGAGL